MQVSMDPGHQVARIAQFDPALFSALATSIPPGYKIIVTPQVDPALLQNIPGYTFVVEPLVIPKLVVQGNTRVQQPVTVLLQTLVPSQ